MNRANQQELATLPLELLTSLQSGLMTKLFTVNQELQGRYQLFVDNGGESQDVEQPTGILRESIERLNQINTMLEDELGRKQVFLEEPNFKP